MGAVYITRSGLYNVQSLNYVTTNHENCYRNVAGKGFSALIHSNYEETLGGKDFKRYSWEVKCKHELFLIMCIITITTMRPFYSFVIKITSATTLAKCTHGYTTWVCIQSMLRTSYCQCPLGISKAHCLCVTFQISIMTNSDPEATKQLPTLVSVVTLETTPQTRTTIK